MLGTIGEYGWTGEFDIEVKDKDGNVVRSDHIKNLITNGGLNLVRDGLEGKVSDTEIKYIALGTDGGSTLNLDKTNTQLGDEQFRKQITKQTDPGTGELRTTVTIQATEATFHIREIGVFAGPDATVDPNSGVMIARVFYDLDKTILESINIVRTDTIGRGA